MPNLHRHGTDRKEVGIFQHVFCNAKRADVYPSALLADAMKPLNVLSKFENHFAIRTVRFQVQLEVDGYFSAQKFSHLRPPQAGRAGTTSQVLNLIFLQIQLQNTCWASPKPDVQHKNALSHLSKDLRCSISSVTHSFSELENAQLVERIRSGFSKPSRILLKVPHTMQNCAVTVCKNAEHDCAEMSSMITQKCTPNQRNKNNLKDSHLIRTTDAQKSLSASKSTATLCGG